MPRPARLLVSLSLLLASACGSSQPAEEPAPEPSAEPASGGEQPQRELITSEECEQRGGTVVGDIGDGATLRPDYVCPSGGAPLANVPLGVEGSVCCPE